MQNLKGGEMMRRRIRVLLIFLLMVSSLISGCYYFSSMKEMDNAQRSFSELKAMDGLKLVPYEYTSAEKFLELSKMEFDENDFDAAQEFAARSKSAAEAGLSEVKKMKK